MSTPVQAFDTRPLTEPVDKAAARRWHREMRASGAFGKPASGAVKVVLIVIAVIVGGSVLMSIGGMLLVTLTTDVFSGGALLPTLLPMALVVAVIVGVVILIVKGRGHTRVKQYRLSRFAAANGFGYVPRLADTKLPGMIFGRGSARASSDLVRGTEPRFVEFANYRYDTGSGKSRTTHRWGYVAIKLDSPLPHIVLDGLGNNSFLGSNLPIRFDNDQRLSLEGDFDEHFALYCPEGYERDALYLFTPDIMARFIDNAAQLDVEIVDDWLILYGRRDFSSIDPDTWAWLFSVVQALLDKLAQWGRWRDDRLVRANAAAQQAAVGEGSATLPVAAPAGLRPPRGVAKKGRRLKTSVSWVTVVIVVLVVGYLAVQGFIWGMS